jgi:hypothetical protein
MYILGILASNKGSRLEISVFQSTPRGSGITSFADRQSLVQQSSDDRMTFLETDEIERQYISEFYDTDATDYFGDTLPQEV